MRALLDITTMLIVLLVGWVIVIWDGTPDPKDTIINEARLCEPNNIIITPEYDFNPPPLYPLPENPTEKDMVLVIISQQKWIIEAQKVLNGF